MRVMILDDHPLFREGLKTIVEKGNKYKVVAEAGDGKEGISLAREHKPDIMLVDISIPKKNGIQVIRELKDLLPQTHFVIISMHSEADYIVEAFRAGASGYMIKESAASQLLHGLETISAGDIFLDSGISQEVILKMLRAKEEGGFSAEPYSTLTSREQEVMRLLAQGHTTKEVAQQLFVSPKTVENHRSRLMKKLGLNTSVDLIRYAARLGLIDLETWAL